MGVPGGLYRPTPRGYNGNPAGHGAQLSVSILAASAPAAGARRLVGPARYRLLGRQAGPTVQGLVGGGLLLLNLGDEGFAEVSMAIVPPSGGDRCSLTASCLLNGASPSRGW